MAGGSNLPDGWSEGGLGLFPHVLINNGQYVELTCPSCGGNARSTDGRFVSGAKGVMIHYNHVHAKDKTERLATGDLLAVDKLRVLRADEVAQLRSSDPGNTIRTKIFVQEDGQVATERTSTGSSLERLKLYPNVVQKSDGNWVELTCNHCQGNAKLVRGSKAQAFIEGAVGLMNHITQSHGTVDRGALNVYEWVFANCAKNVDQTVLNQLKSDFTGNLLAKVLVRPNMEQGRHKSRIEQPHDQNLAEPEDMDGIDEGVSQQNDAEEEDPDEEEVNFREDDGNKGFDWEEDELDVEQENEEEEVAPDVGQEQVQQGEAEAEITTKGINLSAVPFPAPSTGFPNLPKPWLNRMPTNTEERSMLLADLKDLPFILIYDDDGFLVAPPGWEPRRVPSGLAGTHGAQNPGPRYSTREELQYAIGLFRTSD